MEVKQILEKVRQQKEEKRKYYFALQLDANFVKSAIWAVDQERVKVFSVDGGQPWHDKEELIEAVDESLSSVVEKFFPKEELVEPDKVIFGLPYEWVEGEKIVDDKVGILKMLSRKLELIPAGFVVTIEAIIHHLKKTEGVPPTAIFIGLGLRSLVVTLTNLGKIVGSTLIQRSDRLGADLVEGLFRFKDRAQFPSRILVYGTEAEAGLSLEEARQELTGYRWQDEEIGFLHLPKVEILPDGFDIQAVALAGGYEIAKAEEISILEPGVAVDKKSLLFKPEKEIQTAEETFGFIKGKDIVQERAFQEKPEKVVEAEETAGMKEPSEKKTGRHFFSALPKVGLSGLRLPKLRAPKIRPIFPHFHIGNRSLILILVAGLALLFSGVLVAFYWYFPRAEVIIFVAPQKLEKELIFKLDPALTFPNKEDLILPAEKIQTVIEGEKTGETTGVKIIGDFAKGEVTIYNRTAGEKVFAAGTEINGPDGLKFSLDEEVKVASESAGQDYTTIPGKATVAITALLIGTESNLAAETEYGVANFSKSDFVAKNESALSGGTSREIQAVSKSDQDKLAVLLLKELEDKAISQLLGEASKDKVLLEESMRTEVAEQVFDKKVGEEANRVQLTLKIQALILAYNQEELKGLIEDEIRGSVPNDFEYRSQESRIDFELKKINEDETADFTAYFKADLIPRFDGEEIKKNLAGKYPIIGKAYLENLSHVKAVEIKIIPRFPERLVTFPRIADRIRVEIKVE